MRIAVANLFHISNGFNRRPSQWQEWSVESQIAGPRMSRSQPAAAALLQSMIHAANDAQIPIVPILEATAPSGGRLAAQTRAMLLEEFSQRLEHVAATFDGLVLVLTGCMTDEDGNSVDAAVLEAAHHSLAVGTPIAVVWSQLANLDENITQHAGVNLSYDLRDPEIARDIGRRAIDLMSRLCQNKLALQHEIRTLPLLIAPNLWRAGEEPAQSIVALAREFANEPGVYDVSIYSGFPFIDCARNGVSVMVTADAQLDIADSLAGRLRSAIWSHRDDFVANPKNIEIVVHDAMLSPQYPVIIADAGDDPALGAPSEGTGMLWALIDLGAQNAALAAIVDPATVELTITAGVGATITTDLGGKRDRSAGYPIEITAHVRRIIDASGTGQGRTARLTVDGRHGGSIEVVVCERSVEPTPDVFEAVGIDIASMQIVAVKSSWCVHESFARFGAEIIETSTPGITTPVLSFFDYQRRSRPSYPLDVE